MKAYKDFMTLLKLKCVNNLMQEDLIVFQIHSHSFQVWAQGSGHRMMLDIEEEREGETEKGGEGRGGEGRD